MSTYADAGRVSMETLDLGLKLGLDLSQQQRMSIDQHRGGGGGGSGATVEAPSGTEDDEEELACFASSSGPLRAPVVVKASNLENERQPPEAVAAAADPTVAGVRPDASQGLRSGGECDQRPLPAASQDEDSMMMAAGGGDGRPSRHLWLGNIPLRPNKPAIEFMFG